MSTYNYIKRSAAALTILAVIITAVPLSSQQPRLLTFEESLIIAVQSSFTFKQQEMEFKQDYYNLLYRRAALKSNAYLDFLLPQFNESIEIRARINQPAVFLTGQYVQTRFRVFCPKPGQ